MVVIFLFCLYHFIFLMLSLGLSRQTAGGIWGMGNSRLAVLIPAHNEENVIFSSIRSILASDYPRGNFDVYVIADNCTDRTEDMALAAGASVLRRDNKTLRGKQHALEWAFKQVDKNLYDAFIVLDSDNHIDPYFLRVMDHNLAAGYGVIQGFIDTKNPGESWVAANYAILGWYICRLQMFRSQIGLSAILGGTGLCISTNVLNRVGWHVKSLVDDAEYTCRLILAGERVAFAPNAVTYDQKPIGLKDSLRQRLRWMRGQTQISLAFIPRMCLYMAKSWLQGRAGQALRAFDAVMWLPMHLVIFTSILYSLKINAVNGIVATLLTVPLYFMLPMLAQGISLRKAWLYLITTGVFYFTWLPITAYGVLTHGQKTWWRTPHR